LTQHVFLRPNLLMIIRRQSERRKERGHA
jgi:hypothetical protein